MKNLCVCVHRQQWFGRAFDIRHATLSNVANNRLALIAFTPLLWLDYIVPKSGARWRNQTSATPGESEWRLKIIISVCLLTCRCFVKPTVCVKELITGFLSSLFTLSVIFSESQQLYRLCTSSPVQMTTFTNVTADSKQQIICRVLQGHPSHLAGCYRRASSGFHSRGGWNPSMNLWCISLSHCTCSQVYGDHSSSI